MSLYPATEMSSGMRSPRSRIAAMAPIAIASLWAKTAVGSSGGSVEQLRHQAGTLLERRLDGLVPESTSGGDAAASPPPRSPRS